MARADVQFVVQSPFDATCKFPQCLHVTHCRGLYTTAQLVERESKVSSIGTAEEESPFDDTTYVVMHPTVCDHVSGESRQAVSTVCSVPDSGLAVLPAKSLCLFARATHTHIFPFF